MRKDKDRLNAETYKLTYGRLYDGLKIDSEIARVYYIVLYLRKLLFSMIIVYFHDTTRL